MSFAHWNIEKETIKPWTSFQDLILRRILNDTRSTLIYIWIIFENTQDKIYSHNLVYIRHGDVNMRCLTKSRCEYFLTNML